MSLVEAIHFVDGQVRGTRACSNAPADGGEPTATTWGGGGRVVPHASPICGGGVALRPEEGRLLSSAFLIDRAEYSAFELRVREQGRRVEGLRLQLTGPWPPYDFVRMDFGA